MSRSRIHIFRRPLAFALASGAVVISASGLAIAGGSVVVPFNYQGAPRSDVLGGTTTADNLSAGSGEDTVRGKDGGDTINAGTDDDVVIGDQPGQAGADNIDGGVGADEIAGSGGDDIEHGGDGDDVIGSVDLEKANGPVIADSGNDQLFGENGDDILSGGPGNDALLGGSGADSLPAGDGNDHLAGGPGDDSVLGGDGTDTAYYNGSAGGVVASLALRSAVGEGTDTLGQIENLWGSPVADSLIGSNANNAILGLGGDDALFAMGGNDVVNGGDGTNDTVIFTVTGAGVVASLAGGQATGEGTDTLSNVESIVATNGADNLTGSALANVFAGLDGNDTLAGGGGDDALDGGPGKDLADYSASPGAVVLSLASGQATGDGTDTLSGFEKANGSNFADKLTGGSVKEVLSGLDGADIFNTVGGGRDKVVCGADQDKVKADENDRVAGDCERVKRV